MYNHGTSWYSVLQVCGKAVLAKSYSKGMAFAKVLSLNNIVGMYCGVCVCVYVYLHMYMYICSYLAIVPGDCAGSKCQPSYRKTFSHSLCIQNVALYLAFPILLNMPHRSHFCLLPYFKDWLKPLGSCYFPICLLLFGV